MALRLNCSCERESHILTRASSCSFRETRNMNYQPEEIDMNILKRLSLVIGFTLALAASVFAQALCTPGEVHSPPCETAQLTSDDPLPGQTNTPTNSSAVPDSVVVDAAIDFLESVLSLF